MKKSYLFVSLCFVTAFNVNAQKSLDLTQLSCTQFISVIKKMKEHDKGQMRIASVSSFIYGYAAGQNDNAKFNPKELKQVLNALKDTCMVDQEQMLTKALATAYKDTFSD